jgi:hypothetical protein
MTGSPLLMTTAVHRSAKKAGRDKLDRDYTDPRVALKVTRWLATLPEAPCPRRMVEPAVGGGAWVAAARECWPDVRIDAYDIDPKATGLYQADRAWCRDWLSVESHRQRYCLALGNPEYRRAEEHVRHTLRHASRVAYLLRQSFLSGLRRGRGLWRDHPPSVVGILQRRPSFRGGPTDAQDYCVPVWAPTLMRIQQRRAAAGLPRNPPPRIEWIPEDGE